MDNKELDVDIALEVINVKIAQFIRDHKNYSREEFKKELKKLVDEEAKVQDWDEATINKVITVYGKEIKENK